MRIIVGFKRTSPYKKDTSGYTKQLYLYSHGLGIDTMTELKTEIENLTSQIRYGGSKILNGSIRL